MIPVSDAGRQRLENYRGDWLITMTFTLLGGGDDLVVNRDRVWGGSLVLEDAVSNSGQFEIGSTHINQMTVTLLNTDGAYDAVNFLDAKVKVEIGWHSGALLTKGYYTIVDAQTSNGLITLKGYDYMDKFSRAYKLSTRTYPCTLKQIVAEACTFCNVTDGTGNFDHYSQSIAKKPEDDTLTFREIIGYVAQICGYNARVARNGRLQFVRYNLSGFNGEDTFNTITDVYSDRIDQDQIVITGIHVDEENTVVTTDAEGIKTTSLVTTGYDAGTDGYVISIAGNPLIKDGLGQNVASWLYTAFGGVPFRIGSVTHASDPCIEASDIMKVTDKYGTYNMLVSETRFCTGSAQTTSSNAISPRSNEAVQYTDVDKIKTVASEAHIVALAAQGYANDAQRAANEAQSSADSAAQAAQNAWDHADDAGEAAQTAWNRAGDALTAANNAQTSAANAATAASNAQTSANNAQTSANNAQTQAELATDYAGNALVQLAEVEQVADILNWIAEHGSYSRTSDVTIVQNKNYYTKSGDVYTLVTDPQQSEIGSYYELQVDEAISNYVSTHLALNNDGLYVIKDSNGYKLKLTNTSLQVIDASGNVVANYGANITYDSTRPHTIGNNNNYIRFYDSDNDGIADSIAMIADQITIGSKNVGTAINQLENMEIGGRNLLLGTHTAKTCPAISLNSNNYATYDYYTLCRPYHDLFAEDDLLTLSFDWSCTSTSGNFHFEAAAGSPYTFGLLVSAEGTRSVGSSFIDVTSTNTSGHVVATFKATSAAVATGDNYKWFRIRTDGTGWSGKTLTVSNAKIERGNKATDWTPAPEDVNTQIDNIQIGGRNLILDSNQTLQFASGTSNNMGFYTSTDIPAGSQVTLSVQVDAENLVWASSSSYYRIGTEFNNPKVNSGTQYIGCWAYKTGTSGTGNADEISGTSYHKRISFTDVVQTTVTAGKYVGIYIQGISSGTVSISNPKLELGNKATDWTPAPEDIDESIANNANEQDSLKKFIYGDTVYYYTTGGTTYEVRYNEADGQYHYTYESGGESYDAVVAYADLDKSDGEVITTTENGLQGQVEELVGAIDIDPVEPSITLRTTGSQGGTDNAALKISDSKLSFSRRGEEVAYIESTGDDDVSVLDIVNARVHNSLRIGKLEIFEHNDGIGIRRWD